MSISANITVDRDFGRIPFEVNFRVANLTSDEDIVGYLWQFGDGNTSTVMNPSHTYESYGVHTVSLTVYDSSGNTYVEIEPELIKGMRIGFREEVTVNPDRYSVLFINESEIPSGYTAESWEWDFGDGSPYTDGTSPSHDYTSRGSFNVTQRVVITGPGDFRETYSYGKNGAIVRDPIIYNTCNKFLCMGWVRKPSFSASENPLYPFAISDIDYKVIDTEDSVRFAILKDGSDFRLEFMGSKTKVINKNIKVDLNDGNWHSLVYMCTTDSGQMRFLVDGIDIPAEDGYSLDGFKYDIAHGETSRPGGGNVWAPFLYEAGQGVQLFNWRFKVGLNISDEWLNSLLGEDKGRLEIYG